MASPSRPCRQGDALTRQKPEHQRRRRHRQPTPTATSSTASFQRRQLHRLPCLRVGLFGKERRPGASRLPLGGLRRRRHLSELPAPQHFDGLQPLRRPGLPEGLPDARLHQVRRIRRGAARPGYLLRLRLLHLGVPVQCAAARPGQGPGQQMQYVRGPARSRLETRLRFGLSRQGAGFRRHREHPGRPHPGQDRNSRLSQRRHHPPQHPLPANARHPARHGAGGQHRR